MHNFVNENKYSKQSIVIMKKVLIIILSMALSLFVVAQIPELSIEQHLEDYDFAVKYLEHNYAGYYNKVVDSTRTDYESMKARLRTLVEQGKCTGWDAVAQYTAWFEDFHTRLCYAVGDGTGHTKPYNDRYWTRKRIYYTDCMDEYSPAPVACKVTDKTFLIRFPSCYGDIDLDWVKGSIQAYKDSGCRNLVLDIRGNSGGRDTFFNPYWELLYDHEGAVPGVEYRNSAEHRSMLFKELQDSGLPQELTDGIQALTPLISGIDYIPQGLIRELVTVLSDIQAKSMQDVMAIFARLAQPGNDYSRFNMRLDHVSDAVDKAALIIDNSIASSGEMMVRSIKATSSRTTVYGRDNTLGCLDFSNCYEAEMPNCRIRFTCPMTRTIGLPDTGIDNTGIAPDVRISLPLPARLTDNIDEWTIWVAEQLEK